MKAVLILLTVFSVIGLIAGIVLIVSGNIAFAGIVWAVTVLLSGIARAPAARRKKRSTENT